MQKSRGCPLLTDKKAVRSYRTKELSIYEDIIHYITMASFFTVYQKIKIVTLFFFDFYY